VTEQRYRAVLGVRAKVPVTEVAERYGVSRQSVHAWLRRYRDEGPSGLTDRSHKVPHHPWQIPAEAESAVCELRRAHPKRSQAAGFEMDRRGHGTVTRYTVYRVLVRNGLIEPKSRKCRRQDNKRRERPVAMQLWQLDVTASAFLADGREVKIITGIDDHSRHCVIAKAGPAGHGQAGLPGLPGRHEHLRGCPRRSCRITEPCLPAGSSSPARPRCCSTGSAGRTASPSGSLAQRCRPRPEDRAAAPVPAERAAE
jgi:transposase